MTRGSSREQKRSSGPFLVLEELGYRSAMILRSAFCPAYQEEEMHFGALWPADNWNTTHRTRMKSAKLFVSRGDQILNSKA